MKDERNVKMEEEKEKIHERNENILLSDLPIICKSSFWICNHQKAIQKFTVRFREIFQN